MYTIKATYIRSFNLPDVQISMRSEPEPFEDLNIMQEGYEKHYELKPGDTVIDGGAYIGAFTLYASKAVGQNGRVLSFEPVEENYKQILNNCNLNSCDNVGVFNEALGEFDNIMLMDVNGAETSLCQFRNKKDAKLQKCKVSSIDDIVRKNQLKNVDFIKLDVEGYEMAALRGAEKTLKEHDVKLAVASYHRLDYRPTYPDVEKLLTKFGYNVVTENPLHLTTYAWKD